MTTITGRRSHNQPKMQNLPGSLADALDWAIERGQLSIHPEKGGVVGIDPAVPGRDVVAIAEVDFSGIEMRILSFCSPEQTHVA